MTGPELHAFLKSSSDAEEKRERIRLVAAVQNQAPVTRQRLLVEQVLCEDKTRLRAQSSSGGHHRKGGGAAGISSSVGAATHATVRRFVSRLREDLQRQVSRRKDTEMRILSSALQDRGVGRTRAFGCGKAGALSAAQLRRALRSIDVHVSDETSEAVVSCFALEGGTGARARPHSAASASTSSAPPLMSVPRFLGAMAEEFPRGLRSILAMPSTARLVAMRREEHEAYQEGIHRHRSVLEAVPLSVRQAVEHDKERPAVVSAFVRELRVSARGLVFCFALLDFLFQSLSPAH